MPTTKEQACIDFLRALEALDFESKLATRAPDCVDNTIPASFFGENQQQANNTWPTVTENIRASQARFSIDVKEVWAPEHSNVVIVHTGVSATFPDEVKDGNGSVDWNYYGELIFVFEMYEAGDKIKRVLEALDSGNTEHLLSLMERARRNLAAMKL